MDHDVEAREPLAERILDAVGRRVPLTHHSARCDPDVDVDEVGASRLADAQPPELDGRVELGDRLPRRLLRACGRVVHEHVHIAAQEPARSEDDEARDEERRDGVSLREAERGRDEAGEHRERAREVAAEVERVREQRVAPVLPARAERDDRARSVDREHEPHHGERPPRRVDLEVDRRRGDALPPAPAIARLIATSSPASASAARFCALPWPNG